jgi:phosphohistidine phosphatase
MDHSRLVLLRHAKSSWDQAALADHDRPLNSRGRRAGAWVGEHLRKRGITFDLVLCSSAERTVETLALLGIDSQTDVLVERSLYSATAAQLLARLRRITPDTSSALVIAHNPGIHELAVLLTNDDERLASFPTAAMADLVVPAAGWADLRPGVATLQAFVTPKG